MTYPKISVVTINYNQAAYLEEAIISVIKQGYPNLEYIIVDGASTDGSVEVIKKYEKHITRWISEKDNGHFEALEKGLTLCTGEIMAWLNSDDRYHQGAFFTVAKIFADCPEVKWLTGFPTWYTNNGFPIVEMPPNELSVKHSMVNPEHYIRWSRWSRLRYLNYDFMAIQQESTFWKRELWDKAGSYLDTNYKLAFDMELWSRFFKYEKLYTADTLLGGFRVRKAQKSLEQRRAYISECYKVIMQEINNMTFLQRAAIKISYLCSRLLKPAYYYDIPVLRFLYIVIMKLPPVIRYNYHRQKFLKKLF